MLTHSKQGLLALFLVLSLMGCTDDRNRLSMLSGPTMGTTWTIKFTGTPAHGVPALKADLEAALERVNAQMSTYLPDSSISRFNRAEAGETVTLPGGFASVLATALRLSEQTDGAYDVTVGPLVNLWGFGPEGEAVEPPPDADIDQTLEQIGWQRVELAGQKLTQPGSLYLDLSSIAKGYAVDELAALLESRGITNYLVEVGGELRASGKKTYGQPWRIAVEKPVPGVREVKRVLELEDRAVATSGDYRNFFEVDGKLYSHTIDPRTGYPVEHRLASVTVLHERCMMADALATALTVLGPDEGMAFAQDHELAVLFIVRTKEGPEEVMTPAFRALLEEN